MTNVKDFGAVGNGRTDDTVAIQHAINEGGGLIEFPPGVYVLKKPIVVDLARQGRIAIHGSGGLATLRMDGAGPALHLLGHHDKSADPTSVRPLVWERERMPTVSAIEILGTHEQADGIRLEGTMMPTISGILIRRCHSGVHLVKRNRNLLLTDSHIYDSTAGGIGVYFDAVNHHQANIVGCHISYCRHAGIKVEKSEVRNLQVTGCDIEYNFDPKASDCADVWIDARVGTVREVTIASNTIQAKESPGGSNIRIEGEDTPTSHKAGLITITGNVLQSQAVNVRLRSCRGITLTGNTFATGFDRSIVLDRCKNIIIGSNFLDYNPDYEGHRVDGIVIRNSEGCSITNMIVEASRAGTEASGGAIEITDSSHISLDGVQILDPAIRGIDLSNVSTCRITNSSVIDRRKPVTMKQTIRVAGASRGNLLSGNILSIPANFPVEAGTEVGTIVYKND
jgi:polygalacturonase